MAYKTLLVAVALALTPALALAEGTVAAPASSVKASAVVPPAKTAATATDKTDKSAVPVKTAAVVKTHKAAHHKLEKPKSDATTDKTAVKPAG